MTKLETNKRPLILITNDDGYFAPGLKVLIDMVKPYGDVVVVAPEQGVSGMSHAITIKFPLRVTKLESEEGVEIFKVNGTPVDCVKIALNQLLDRRPDILVSGINHGSNSSISVIYSGTMGGAIEGSLNEIPSIGYSLCSHSMNADFSVAKKHGESIFKKVLANGLPKYTCLNVNFPVVSEDDFKGVKVCRQARGVWKEEYEKRIDPHNGTYYWLTGSFNNHENGATDTDEWALANNFASIVPVRNDFTDFDSLDKITNLNSIK
ncbi:MAG: 5'/3'-nucleotidase SurE [Salinivirgaceae bacterium]|nr:5'/3'-nucleotidase SurE [Salinivirgaceae bacterium]